MPLTSAERNRKYRAAHPERTRESSRKYDAAHPEKVRERRRAHYHTSVGFNTEMRRRAHKLKREAGQ